MDEPVKNQRPAKRQATKKEPKKESSGRTKAVAIDEVAYGQVAAQSKKLKLNMSEYASAAISFFAESGLDPTAERPEGLASLSSKVSQVDRAIRQQNVDIGNRLISIIRGWEKNQYAFLQQQQMSINTYLELIESNILQHLVSLETNLFDAMIAELFKLNVEADSIRGLTTRLFIEATKKSDSKPSIDRYWEQKKQLDGEHIQILEAQMREFIKTNAVPKPRPTPKRAVTPAPQRTVAPAPATPAAAPKT